MRVSNNKKRWVQYNDNNIKHVIAGPEYGQPWRGAGTVWAEYESPEYISWVEEIQSAILRIRRINF